MAFNKKKAREEANRGGFYQFAEGENVVRILPPSREYFDKDITYIALTYFLHYGIPEGAPPVTCPKTTDPKNHWNVRCPICEKCKAIKSAADKDDKETQQFVYDRKAKQRYLFNVIVTSDKPDEETKKHKVVKLSVGWKIYKAILDVAQSDKYEDIGDVKKGRGFIINMTPESKTKTGFRDYSVTPEPNPSSVYELLPKDWIEAIEANEKWVEELAAGVLSFEELKSVMENSGIPQFMDGGPSRVQPAKQYGELDEEGNTKGEKSTPEETPEETPAKEETPASKPDCYGKYERGSEKCAKCESRIDCINKFIESQE